MSEGKSHRRLPVHERVFVVLKPVRKLPFDWLECAGSKIWQGYTETGESWVRIREEERGEFEYYTRTQKVGGWIKEEQLSEEERDALSDETGHGISFTRLHVPWESVEILLDVFGLEGERYMRAKVKFDTPDAMAAFSPPDWLREVTGDESHSMRSIAKNGFPKMTSQ